MLRTPDARGVKLRAVVGLSVGVLSASLGAWSGASQPAAAVQRDEVLPYASLEELARDPQAWLGKSVRVRFQVESHPSTWNPYFTRFGSEDWRAASVWADEQFLWQRETWESPAARVFARRGSVADEALAGAPQLARFEALAHVTQVFAGAPWLEVREVQRIAGAIGEGSVLHATRALEHSEKGQWRNAVDNFDRALVGDMPAAARAELRRLRDEAQGRLGQR